MDVADAVVFSGIHQWADIKPGSEGLAVVFGNVSSHLADSDLQTDEAYTSEQSVENVTKQNDGGESSCKTASQTKRAGSWSLPVTGCVPNTLHCSESRWETNTSHTEQPMVHTQHGKDTISGKAKSAEEQETTAQTEGHTKQEKDNIQRRLLTYTYWSGVVSALQLAIAGFVFVGSGDKVQCETCKIRFQNWTKGDKPIHVHRTYSPRCAFLELWFPEPHNGKSNSSSRRPGYIESKAKYLLFITIAKRRESFQGWPRHLKIHSPENMALAGFFYIGSADRARCFYCGLTLRDWSADDNPLDAHLKWSPECDYVRHIHHNQSKEVDVITVSGVHGLPISPHEAVKPRVLVLQSASGGKELERSVDAASCKPSWKISTQVEAVLAMGIPEDLIMQAITHRRKTLGNDFPDAVSLYSAVEEIAENGE